MTLIGRFALGIGLAAVSFSAASATVISATEVAAITAPPPVMDFAIDGGAAFAVMTVPVEFVTLVTDGAISDSSIIESGSVSIPEPASLLALGIGLAGLWYGRRRPWSESRTAMPHD